MPQSLSNLIMHLKPYWLDVASAVAGIEINKIIYFPISGAATFYTKTAANLTTALAGASAGEIVYIHGPCTLAANYTIPAGVALMGMNRTEVILQGQISQGDDSVIYNLGVYNAANSAATIYGVVGPQNGTSYIYYCDISAVQSGAGNAYAIGATRGLGLTHGNIEVRHSKLYGSSVGGSGYAGRSTAGYIYDRHNDYYGSTARWILV